MASTTVLVDAATRDALAAYREATSSPSLDAAIRLLLRSATPSASETWAQHATKARTICKRHGVRRLIAFGSRVRDDRTPTSDLDLVVDMPSDSGVAGLLALRDDLASVLGVKVDLGDMPGAGTRLWNRLTKEGVVLVGPPL